MITSLSRRFASTLLSLTASACLLVGCTDGSGDSDSDSESGTTTASTSKTSTSGETSTSTSDSDSSSGSDSETGTTTSDPTTTTETTGSLCGDGTVDEGETCDDGNNDDGDGCSATCMTEAGSMCNPLLQDCPEGQKCTASNANMGDFWNINICIDLLGEKTLGEPCDVLSTELGSGDDDCGVGLICLQFDNSDGTNGICTAFCDGEMMCPGQKDICVPANDGVLPVCLNTCDPLIQDCPFKQGCYGDKEGEIFLCFKPDAQSGGMDNDECAFDNACLAGFQCLPPAVVAACDPDFEGCCNPFCALDGDNSECDDGNGEVCTPFFGMDNMVPPWENVGICTLP